ncbi:ABC transporter ATP-binding protein [Lactococcus lactis]|uniref:ABC transporter ATP-binding protein n=1 Tax=Lactococcus lactis TaxID=1358 RepID=UPI00117A9975|nr:ABC transporter ATP-binding protein [Lactococcus lactis]TRW68983.1 ABC transporter ATP-binding protein [Lactococcus lactis]
MENILKVEKLSKTYKKGRKALDDLNFTVTKGEILGFLGPNGAGKSTTINIISTLLKSNAGTITYFDNPMLNIRDIKKRVGVVPQELAIYEDLTAFQNVKFFASLYGVKNIDLHVEQALERVGLIERKSDKASTFSGGMKRRLNIACAIAHSPELIIFDEPTVGIDPQSRNHILESIKQLRENGATIIYTTHYMEEVQQLCDRVIIMDGGVVLLNDNLTNILKNHGELKYQLQAGAELNDSIVEGIREIHGIGNVVLDNLDTLSIAMTGESDLSEVLSFLVKRDIHIKRIITKENNLEEVFLNLTGKKLRD